MNIIFNCGKYVNMDQLVEGDILNKRIKKILEKEKYICQT